MWENCKKFYMEESTKFDDDRETSNTRDQAHRKQGLGSGRKRTIDYFNQLRYPI